MTGTRLTISTLLFLVATSVFAQATRTFVSGVGDDANPCSRTAPCKTFAGAISKTASNGEINALDSAGYGAVTITKAIRIDGHGVIAGVITSGITVNTTGNVELANLSLDGAFSGSFGVTVYQAGSLLIDNCDITGYTGTGVYISTSASTPVQVNNSRIHNLISGASGIYATTSAGTLRLRITNSLISDIWGSYGLWTNNGVVALLDHSQISGVSTAVIADAGSIVDLNGSTLAHNTGYGIYSAGTNSLIRVYGSFIQDNTVSGYNVTGSSVIQSAGNNSIQSGTGSLLPWGLQ